MKQATINNYLFFPGDTEDALQYYQRHLGATIDLLMRFSDSPEPIPEGMVPEGYENKVMHCEFTIGDCKIMASDGCGGEVKTADRGFSLALTIPCEDEARRVFNALADGGEIQMPLEKTFWSPLFGQVKDKFGIAWMVMLPSPEEL
ncbi:MAG: VOC family protein [Pseudomonadales bacterium]|nr:VOC family protein [Pseudomonadales bacterium]